MKLYFKLILRKENKGNERDMEKLVITEKKDFKLHWMIIAILTILLLISSIIFFIYSNYDGIDADTLKRDYVKRDNLTFNNLPQSEKDNYILKEEYTSLEERYSYLKEENIVLSKEAEKLDSSDTQRVSLDSKAQKISSLEKDNQKIEDENHKLRVEIDSLKAKITTLENSVLVETSKVDLKTSTNVTKYSDKENLKQIGFVSCKDMALGSYEVTKDCSEKVKNFLSTTPKDAVYEIVAMVSEDDEKTISDLTKSVDKLAVSGLGRYRMNEAKWLLIKYINKDVKFKLVTYDTKTNTSRGFVIKVYK